MSIIGFPLLLIPLAICNIIAFLMPGLAFDAPVARLPLPSGTVWPITISDLLLGLGIVFLVLEVLKGARPGAKYITDHLLSFLVFGAAVGEFVALPQFGTSTFFLLTALALADFLSGIGLRGRHARRDARTEPAAEPMQGFEQPAPAAMRPEPIAAEPAPGSALPVATLIAEAVLLDHPIPSMAVSPAAVQDAAPEVAAPTSVTQDAAPEIASPGLQPVNVVSPPESPAN
jgi:hypothetical protein